MKKKQTFVAEIAITICCGVTFIPVRVGVDDDCDDVDDIPDDRCNMMKKKFNDQK